MSKKPSGYSLVSLFIRDQIQNIKNHHTGKNFRHKNLIPLMRNREILLLEELLQNLNPQKCLEWGSGYSILHFPRFISPQSSWIAVEHYGEWAERVNNLNTNPRVKTVWVPPQVTPWTDPHDDGAYSDLADYIEYPGKSAEYDFILVDGHARVDCLERAYDWISKDGVVVLHDAMRTYYHDPLKKFSNQAFFKIWGRKDQGLWLGSKGKNLNAYLNVKRHEKLWAMHNWNKSDLS